MLPMSDEKINMAIMNEWKSLPSNKLYQFYAEKARHPKGERFFRNYVSELCDKGLLKVVGEKKGRIYESV
jgi:L-rhamnose isomerase